MSTEAPPAEAVDEGPAADAVRKTIAAVWRIESGRLLGGLMRMVRDVGLAEDLAQETLLAALERWPGSGVPANPGAWLTTVARNRALDVLRRRQLVDRKHAELAVPEPEAPALEAALDAAAVGDDLLRLILIACSPVLSPEARVALTLRLLGGLSTAEIAHAFLVPEPTIAQRLVRAKRTLAEAQVPFDVPRGAELAARVPSVLEVIYLVFNAGYAASRGEARIRFELCAEALRLGRVFAGLVPEESEAHGLLALMELHASRSRTRVDARGEAVLLLDQDRARWDHLLIQRGLAGLGRAMDRARDGGQPLGPYTLQAAISACHARARTAEATDWPRIVALYDALAALTGSPVVELNRAVAISMAFGPAEALDLVEELAEDPALRRYHLLPSVHGDLLFRLGRLVEARAQFARAASLASHTHDQAALLARAAACVAVDSGEG